MEFTKKLMEEIQTNEDTFFEADKFACTQEVFDLIRKLPNFKPADPTVPESGYLNGKPIYVHPACAPNTLMGLKNREVPAPEVYMCPIDFQSNPKNFTDFYGDITYETKDYKKIRVRNKSSLSTYVKAFAGLSLVAIVCAAILIWLVV